MRRPSTDGVVIFDPPPRRRPFAPGDVVRLLVGAALVVAGWLLTEVGRSTIAGFERDLVSAFARLPGHCCVGRSRGAVHRI
jgi:hypothetical protein